MATKKTAKKTVKAKVSKSKLTKKEELDIVKAGSLSRTALEMDLPDGDLINWDKAAEVYGEAEKLSTIAMNNCVLIATAIKDGSLVTYIGNKNQYRQVIDTLISDITEYRKGIKSILSTHADLSGSVGPDLTQYYTCITKYQELIASYDNIFNKGQTILAEIMYTAKAVKEVIETAKKKELETSQTEVKH